jgi:hypothetical protein
VNSIDYINAFMRYCRLYEEAEEPLLDGRGGGKKGKKRQQKKKIVYRYDWLLDEARKGDNGNGDSSSSSSIQTLQDKIIQFVIYKKKMGLGANGIANYISPLHKFYWVNGIKGIEWELVRTYKPENVKKTPDRESTLANAIILWTSTCSSSYKKKKE